MPEDLHRNLLDGEILARGAVCDIRKLIILELLDAAAVAADDEPRSTMAMRIFAAGDERVESLDAMHLAEG
jgi:hypothetical protein